MRQLVLDIAPASLPGLDDFVEGRNGEVLQALRDWANGGPERFITLWGEAGAGKSHLVSALADFINRRAASQSLPAAACIRCSTTTRFAEDPVSFLLVDDVDRLSPEGAVSLFHRYNERREGEGRLLVTSPCPPAALNIMPDLTTRLGWGLVLKVHPLNDREKIDALQSRANRMGVNLPNEAAEYILNRWTRDTPSLFSLMDELNRWSLSAHRPAITIPLIRDALASLQHRNP
jgi:DnaA family protein